MAASSTTTLRYERSPVDVLRSIVGAVVLVALLLLAVFFENALLVFTQDLLTGLQALPRWLLDLVMLGCRVLTLVLVVAAVAAVLRHRRWRLLVTGVVTGVVAVAAEAIVTAFVQASPTAIASVRDGAGVVTEPDFPTGPGVALIAALVTVAAPWAPRRWRRLAWGVVVATTFARFVTAPTSFDSVLALSVGWLVGSLVLVVAGGPVRRPTIEAVAEGMAAVGLGSVTLAAAGVDARGSTPYFGTTAGGERIFAKALGADERSADLLFRAYRRVSPRRLGDERSFSSLRRTVEHEALVALAAADMGVRTPPFRGFARVEPDAFVLAYGAIDGSSLDGVPPELFDADLLAEVWAQVGILRRHRVAHRDLRLANVFRADDGAVWLIDFGFSELAASDLLLANDLAELLASTSLVVGPDRAIAAALAAAGPVDLATAAARLRPFALSGATRTAMKARPGELDALRARVAALPAHDRADGVSPTS